MTFLRPFSTFRVTPFVPTPGDGGLSGALTAEVENFTVVAAPGQPPYGSASASDYFYLVLSHRSRISQRPWPCRPSCAAHH